MKIITYFTFILFFILITFTLICSIIVTTQHTTPTEVVVDQYSAPFQALRAFDCEKTNNEHSISYQLHSWNDLREWHQTLRKGGYWFKIDLHWMNQTYCETLKAFAGKNTTNGCFILTHDSPLPNIEYNTTYELLELITQPSIEPFFQKETKIHIALCFKCDEFDPCDGSDAAFMWTTLMDELFNDYEKFLENTGYNIEFILDGAATPGGGRACLDQKWRPWNATYIYKNDGLGALFSNNPVNGSDRFQIMNTETMFPFTLEYLKIEANYSYGKFLGGNYPFLNWEPSPQDEILEVVDFYLDTNIINPAGFRFSINIDQVVFDIYAGSRSGNAWNKCLNTNKASDASIISIEFDRNLFPDNVMAYLFTAYSSYSILSPTSPIRQYIISFVNDNVLGDVQTTNPQSLPSNTPSHILSSSLSSLSLNNTHTLIFHLFADSSFDFLVLELINTRVNLLSHGTIYWNNQYNWVNGKMIENTFNSTINLLIASTSDSCGIQLQPFIVDINSSSYQPTSDPVCAVPSSIEVNGISLDLMEVSEGMSNSPCKVGEMIGFLGYSDASDNIYFTLFCMNEITSSFTFLGKNNPLDVGLNPSVSLALVNSEIIVMAVHEKGYCWNSHYRNIRSGPKICDNKPHSIPYILNYNYGPLDSFLSHSTNSKILSPCDEQIFHGVYDSGSSPSVTLYVTPTGEVGVAEVHEGVPSIVVSPEAIECGLASHYEGLILDSWDLDPLSSIP